MPRIFATRLLSALLLALSVTPLLCGGPARSAEAALSPPHVQQYESAKQETAKLEKDPKRGAWREPWEKLAKTFLDLYEGNVLWADRPAALFRSADAMEKLGARSRRIKDSREALARYERLVKENPTSPLADDALYRAARIRAERLADPKGAVSLLKKIASDYPDTDSAPIAADYAKELASASADQIGTTTLVEARWRDAGGFVQITLIFDRPTAWRIVSRPQDKRNGSPDRLIVELPKAKPASTIRPATRTSSSLLRRMRVELAPPDATRLLLDFAKLRRFTATTKTNPFRIIVTGSPTDKGMPHGLPLGRSLKSERPLRMDEFTVALDPGHGGKDPGTSRNGVVEREAALDLAKRVGALLKTRKIDVRYTRADDAWVALDARSRTANAAGADLFVSIHVNAASDEGASGFETYVFGPPGGSDVDAPTDHEGAAEAPRSVGKPSTDAQNAIRLRASGEIAETIQRHVMARLKKTGFATLDGGVKNAPFRVLATTSMPGVLLEVGYCSNAREAKNLASPAYRAALAEGIAEGILDAKRILDELE